VGRAVGGGKSHTLTDCGVIYCISLLVCRQTRDAHVLLDGQAKLGTKTGTKREGGIANLAAADAKTSEPKRTTGKKDETYCTVRRRRVRGGRELKKNERNNRGNDASA
jgi:hypothetical protein